MTSESENNAVDTYIVLDENNEAITDPERIRVIRNTLCDALDEPEEFDTIIRRRTSRVLKQFDVPTQVTISNDPLMRRTVLEVTAEPHPGCKKFVERFGLDAMNWVNSPVGKNMCLRGINTKVVQAGTIHVDDKITKA